MSPQPFYREEGSGPGVACLHANASTSGQWRGLMELLAPNYHVVAPDLYDAGKSPSWPSRRVIRLKDEVAFIQPVLARAGAPMALVGHSYGAAVALKAALADPVRVRALALYEPTLFSLLDARKHADAAEDIRAMLVDAIAALDAGSPHTAAGRFIDYWMGDGAWAQMPETRKTPIAASVKNLRRWAFALSTEATPLAAFRTLEIPVLCMVGARTRPSARGVARVLASALPQVEVVELEDVGHMGPVTHPDRVNETIARFLERHHVPREGVRDGERVLRVA